MTSTSHAADLASLAGDDRAASPSGIERWRFIAVALFFVVSGLALIGRTAYLQVVQYDYFQQLAKDEHWGTETVLAQRGAIRDRNGHPLAMTLSTFTISIQPSREISATAAEKAATALAPILQVPAGQILDAYRSESEKPIVVKEGLPYDLGVKVQELDLPGVVRQRQVERVYPEGSIAAAILGFVGRDHEGLAGLEADFDDELAGRSGEVIYERDTRGEAIPLGFRETKPPQEGVDVSLTIDRYVQRIVEQTLDETVKQHRATGGTIIVVEPQTGAILAMASRPTFDLKHLDLSDPKQLEVIRNRAITDVYEPGSVFKIVTTAIALELGAVTPESSFTCTGSVVKQGWPIRTWNYVAHEQESVRDILVHSCNVGTVWLSDLIGPDRFYAAIADFGFGKPTGIRLGGEVGGQIHLPNEEGWSPLLYATNSFGQGLTATPLQMVMAVAAIANDGVLMRPQIVQRLDGPDGVRNVRPVAVRQVISPENARKLAGMLHAVVEEGAPLARVPGYEVAGKTGTSEKPIATGYGTQTIASFAGFGPLEDPRFVILVKIDEPQDSPFGGIVAAPVFSKLAQQLMVYYRIPPSS